MKKLIAVNSQDEDEESVLKILIMSGFTDIHDHRTENTEMFNALKEKNIHLS